MSGVWVFKNGVVRLEVKPEKSAPVTRRKALVYVPADETVESHEALQRRLLELGWELYNDGLNRKIVQFRRPGTAGGGLNNLITLPADFALVNSLHMHDIAEGNPGQFEVVNVVVEVERRRTTKALVYTPGGSVVRSYAELEALLRGLGWERYYEDPALYQFHRRGSLDLISLPADFARFGAVHMYDIVIKNREHFRVVDI